MPHSDVQGHLGSAACDIAGTPQACANLCAEATNCQGFGFNAWYLDQIEHHNPATTTCCNLQSTPFCDDNGDWDWYATSDPNQSNINLKKEKYTTS